MSTLFFISLVLSFVLLASVAALDLLGKSVPVVLLGAALAAAGLSLWRAIAERPKSTSQR
jgi:hypothetical protein